MRKIFCILFIAFQFFLNFCKAQTLFLDDWAKSGLISDHFVEDTIVNIMDFGADSTGKFSNDSAVIKALSAVEKYKSVLYFPEGKYLFNKTISINRNFIVLRGKSYNTTRFIFDLKGRSEDCINISGKNLTDSSSIISDASRGINHVRLYNSDLFKTGDFVQLICSDSSLLFSSWAYGSVGQVMRIESVSNNIVYFNSSLRYNYVQKLNPYLRKIQAHSQVGLECFSMIRLDLTSTQTSNISMDYVVDSWITGISSDSCNFAHVSLSHCAHVEIKNSYFQQAFSYGGGGQGYGIALQFATSECKIENNIFNHLRHSILFQAGANGNVVSYNYMTDPYWTEGIYPTNSSGDIVLHGNFPFANLIEGNINQNSIIDNSHGLNGPYNTFFRNRIELYGLIFSTNNSGDSLQFIQNEITNSSLGYYLIQGNGHLQLANNIKGQIIPQGSIGLSDNSFYLSSLNFPFCYDALNFRWPYIEEPYNTGSIPAKVRFQQNKLALCECEIITEEKDLIKTSLNAIQIYPNPGHNFIHYADNPDIIQLKVYTLEGKLVYQTKQSFCNQLDLSELNSGSYFIHFKTKENTYFAKWIKN
ncbi:MAG: T9SS type A sorting domain-containing protein [Saprospiraceae bacterium]